MRLLAAEALILRIIAALALIDVALLYQKSISVDIVGYISILLLGVGAVAIGQYYRVFRNENRIAMTATAAGSFALFTIAGSVFNYMFLPIRFEPIDDVLFRFDAVFGYHWPDIVGWAAHHAWMGVLLHLVYLTSMAQLLCVILVLGFSGQEADLHRFLLTGIFGALLSIGFWIFFPTFGAKAYYTLPPSVLEAIPLAVDPAYGAELVRLGHEGVNHLSPKNVLGLIGFPSFHIIMACMSVYFVPRRGVMFAVALVLNVVMLPAVLVQGGHHLSDILGGMVTFAAALVLASAVMHRLSGSGLAPAQDAGVIPG